MIIASAGYAAGQILGLLLLLALVVKAGLTIAEKVRSTRHD